MKKRPAVSIIEIVLAVGIMVVGLAAALLLLTIVEQGMSATIAEAQASFYAEEGIQATISIADRSWSVLTVGAHGLAVQGSPQEWVFSGTSDTSNGMTRVVTVSSVDSDTMKVDVTVTWNPAPNRTAAIQEQVLLTDWAFI